ncbi:unnamed protein product [Vitrella brassicaformis CCMP3155]|uniref:BTB domain-containing protein n=1 Tax=Vitrella brassicaformis (strain CCMP3155) TaxID=1169540 RepID=A0A0G4EXU8_VITBC|nr:unnamed protein product [Vitrella brassicaformis CCMP3155]|eukprot:CEM03439.1 unnamed protein product [Vitrella brassicaformis CCMP3155]
MAASAAAAAAAGEKRKCPDGAVGESASLGALHQSIQYSRSVTNALQAMLEDLEERQRALGGSAAAPNKPVDELMKEVLELNVSGEQVRVQRSTLCAVKDSVLATLFGGKFDAAFIRDEKDRIFLQIYPPAFTWLVMNLIMYEEEQVDNIAIPPSKQHDTPFTYWVELLLWDPFHKRRPGGDAFSPLPTQPRTSSRMPGSPLRLS